MNRWAGFPRSRFWGRGNHDPLLGLIDKQTLVSAHVPAPIPHFIPFEVGNIVHMFFRLGFVATVRRWTRVSAMRIEVVIDMAVEVFWAMKPRANANKDSAHKPFRPVIAVRRAIVRSVIVVAVRTVGSDPDVNGDLSVHCGSGYREAGYRKGSQSQRFEFVHRFLLVDILSGMSSSVRQRQSLLKAMQRSVRPPRRQQGLSRAFL